MLEIINIFAENWGAIMGYTLAAIAGFDKVAHMVIKTLANVRDTWRENFPKNYVITHFPKRDK